MASLTIILLNFVVSMQVLTKFNKFAIIILLKVTKNIKF